MNIFILTSHHNPRSLHIPHDSAELRVLITCRYVGQNGEGLEFRLCPTVTAFPPKIPNGERDETETGEVNLGPAGEQVFSDCRGPTAHSLL